MIAWAQSACMTNTLDLDPEWGAIDLIEEVEAMFGVKIADEDAARCWTVGDVYKLLPALSPDCSKDRGSCASSVVFYRFRRSIAPSNRADLTPNSPLPAPHRPRALFRALQRDTGLRLPSLKATAIGNVGGLLFFGGIICGVIALLTGAWLAALALSALIPFGILLLWLDPARLPDDISTVGDLVRRTVPLNAAKLVGEGARSPDRWSILTGLAAEHGRLLPDQIGPETYLLHKGMKLATAGK